MPFSECRRRRCRTTSAATTASAPMRIITQNLYFYSSQGATTTILLLLLLLLLLPLHYYYYLNYYYYRPHPIPCEIRCEYGLGGQWSPGNCKVKVLGSIRRTSARIAIAPWGATNTRGAVGGTLRSAPWCFAAGAARPPTITVAMRMIHGNGASGRPRGELLSSLVAGIVFSSTSPLARCTTIRCAEVV